MAQGQSRDMRGEYSKASNSGRGGKGSAVCPDQGRR